MTEDEKREFRSPSGAKTKDEKPQANGRKTKARKENVAAARDPGPRRRPTVSRSVVGITPTAGMVIGAGGRDPNAALTRGNVTTRIT